MGTTLHASHPGPHITATLCVPGPRRVATAYLDHTAPELLPLRTGDQLIVNAARAAVRAHATSPTTLARFLDAGVQVLSTPNLFLDSATTIWQVGRVVPLAGIGNRTRTSHDFLPAPVRRMLLRYLSDYTPTGEDENHWTAPAPGTDGPNPPLPHPMDT